MRGARVCMSACERVRAAGRGYTGADRRTTSQRKAWQGKEKTTEAQTHLKG